MIDERLKLRIANLGSNVIDIDSDEFESNKNRLGR